MLYKVLMRMIEKGQTDGLESKIDIFYAAGKLTQAQYDELTHILNCVMQNN